MTLVLLGAALFTMCLAYAFPRGDPTRMAANVASGVGFLGAGVITTNNNDNTPSGLTTAAAIWMSAALGVVSALGLHLLSTVTALITVGILRLRKQHQQEEEEQISKSEHNDDEFHQKDDDFHQQKRTTEQNDTKYKHEDDKFRASTISIVQDSSFDSLSSLDTGRFNKIANSSHGCASSFTSITTTSHCSSSSRSIRSNPADISLLSSPSSWRRRITTF
eukprot:CAMPEP_0194160222 /NCGR_PEP_ID=MMETSP0152-20130528/78272_1 /TAXON_ID=1049557 /ORGANISM="Thalassiothrix antarctica, Strain L6-D1" /LENGTH=219 /DNA_ID=CAMNT_0038869889 /DNA_START=474 /DNA_END=1133 /DNA_ORIENTATION=+